MSGEKPTVWTGMALGLLSALATGIVFAIAFVLGAPAEVAGIAGGVIGVAMYAYLQSKG